MRLFYYGNVLKLIMISDQETRGYFIVFEGIDGSGSSTQADLLHQYFLSQNQKSVLSPEPSNGKIGKLLREFLASPPSFLSDDLFEQQMAYLFTADRHFHLYNNIDGVKKLVEQNINVITTRYYFSSLAYNGKTESDFHFVTNLNQNFPPPDLLIYLDIPVDVALSRIGNRPFKEVYENKQKLTLVRQNFEKIINEYKYSYLKIDACQTQTEIHQQIIDFLTSDRYK